MNDEVLKTPDEWLATDEFVGNTVMDPDGWRSANELPWNTPITYDDFVRRLNMSTVRLPH